MERGVTVLKAGKATIRIHGKADPDKVREATQRYMSRVCKEEMNREKEQSESA